MPSNGSGIEDRSGGADKDYELYFRFNGTVASVGAASATCGSVALVGIDPNDPAQVEVDLTGLDCNGSRITVTVNDVVDSDGNTLSTASTTLGLLVGDVNGDGVVSRTDSDVVLAHEGQTTNPANFRADVSAKESGIGHIDISDANLVKRQQGSHL